MASELLVEFAAFTQVSLPIDFQPHTMCDLIDAVEIERERAAAGWPGLPFTFYELMVVEIEAATYDDDDPLWPLAPVPPWFICKDRPADSVL